MAFSSYRVTYMFLPIIIAGDFNGEIKIKSIEPDSFSREMLIEVKIAEIIISKIAINPGIKKNALFTSGLNKILVFTFTTCSRF